MTHQSIELLPPEEYRSGREHIYPSAESFRWFIRRHRTQLVEAGAIVRPAKRILVQPEAFDRAVMQIGRQQAASREANPRA